MPKALTVLIVSLCLFASAIQATSGPPSPKMFDSAPLGTTDYPWTMFHHDSLRSGATPARAPSTASLMWNHTTGAQVYSSPAVADGTVFVASYDNQGTLYAIDEYSGQVRWTYPTGTPVFASPAVANGIVYVASKNGVIFALNEQTGGLIWFNGNSQYAITSSPVVVNGRVIFATWCQGLCNPPGRFRALSAATGAVLWETDTSATAVVRSSPSVHNGRVFFGQIDGIILALNETTGVQLWSALPSGGVDTAPAVAYGRVFVGTSTGFVALNELTGATFWVFNTSNLNSTSGAVAGGLVYFGTGGGNIYAVNATTGLQVWSFLTGAGVSSSPALALGSNTLLVGSNDHYLYALNLTSGLQIWKYLTGAPIWSSPAVADGRVFFGSDDFKVYALGAKLVSLQVSISSSQVSLRPGAVSNLTITVTNGTSRVSGAALIFSSSAGGGFSPPTEKSPGVYHSNYTAPLVSATTTTTIQVTASKTGYLDGSATTTLSLNPFPALKVYVTPRPTSVPPGGDVLLLILVMNGTQPVDGASIFLTSTGGGSFSSSTPTGGGNYTVIYSASLQSSSPTLAVQASKPGFSPGAAQVTITVGGVPDPVKSKLFGLPLFLILVLLVLVFVLAVALLARRQKGNTDLGPWYHPEALSYCLHFLRAEVKDILRILDLASFAPR